MHHANRNRPNRASLPARSSFPRAASYRRCRTFARPALSALLGLLPQLGHTQGSPDLVWMRGGDIYPSQSLSLSSDGQTVVSGYGPTVKFRRVSDGYLTRTIAFPQFTSGVSVAAISPDGKFLYVGGSVVTTSVSDLSYLIRLSDESVVWSAGGYLRNPRFSLDGKYIGDLRNEYAVRASDGAAAIANAQGGYNYGDFSADGTSFISAGDFNYSARFTIFDLPALSYHSWYYKLPNNSQSSAAHAAYSPDKSKIAAVIYDAGFTPRPYILNGAGQPSGSPPLATLSIPAYQITGGQFRQSFTLIPFYWNTGGIFALYGTSVDANGNASGSVVDYEAVRYDPVTYARTRIYKLKPGFDGAEVNGFTLTPDGTRLAVGGPVTFRSDGTRYANPQARIRVYDTLSSNLVYFMDKEQSGFVYSVAISPDGQTIASGAYDGTINLWNRADGAFIRQFDANSSISALSFSPDGTTLISAGGARNASGDGNVKVWRVSDGALRYTLHVADNNLYTLQFSPDGTTFAVGEGYTYSYTPHVFLYSTATGQFLRSFQLDSGYSVQSLAFSPDGARIVAGGGGGPGAIWRVSDGARICNVPLGGSYAITVAFSPDGARVACTNGNQIRIVNAATGAVLQTMNGHTADIPSLAFSPDGKTLLSGGFDGTLRFWDVVTGAQKKYYDKETANVGFSGSGIQSIAFTPDGQYFSYGRADSTTATARNPFFVPLAIAGAGASNLKANSATLSWTTNLTTSGTVAYGTTPNYGSTVSDATQATAHSVNLTGLAPNTLYYYRVGATGAGQTASTTGTFLTSKAGTPQVQIAAYALSRSGSTLIANLTLSNPGTATATGVTITSATLGSANANSLPVAVADISVAGTQTVPGGLRFAAAGLTAGTNSVLRVNGTYNGGSFSASYRVVVP